MCGSKIKYTNETKEVNVKGGPKSKSMPDYQEIVLYSSTHPLLKPVCDIDFSSN